MTAKKKHKLVEKKVSDLIPYVNNSRVHDEEQIIQICSSIKEFGFTNPVLIDGENGVIAGHGRLMAAKKLELKTVPCIVLADLTEAQKKAYVIADNQIALNSSWDMEKLNLEMESLEAVDFDLDLLGFDENFFQVSTDEFFDVPEAPKASDDDDPDRERKRTDDGYSAFELIMLHDNKLKLIEVINQIKNDLSITATEDALMVLVDKYVSQEEIH
ncbi:ParB/Srx family N-terminal domain-containing protein [Endozoicomonas sp. SESOKO1]|uniref:ParB/Srx family N-terminal domain-containing protein n=1 Tax=Endozoicomonas sp. SESOKO1 TaxID=2828742 RepID=UPI002147F9FF|nr:ParB/Srx family N-terminal domain-containing protein [Endozoicomonas sp. SESOKO1]